MNATPGRYDDREWWLQMYLPDTDAVLDFIESLMRTPPKDHFLTHIQLNTNPNKGPRVSLRVTLKHFGGADTELSEHDVIAELERWESH
jgi:hypothetical protein